MAATAQLSGLSIRLVDGGPHEVAEWRYIPRGTIKCSAPDLSIYQSIRSASANIALVHYIDHLLSSLDERCSRWRKAAVIEDDLPPCSRGVCSTHTGDSGIEYLQ